MNLDLYLIRANTAMFEATMVFDNAKAAEKLMDWSCSGADNIAWTEGPYLSPGTNRPNMDTSLPYCMRISKESAMVAQIMLGPKPDPSENGGYKVPVPPREKGYSTVEPIIGKLCIIEQFEIFKKLLMGFDGPYSAKQCQKWKGRISTYDLDRLRTLADRRNEVTHESPTPPTMKEAVEYYYELRQYAKNLWSVKNIPIIDPDKFDIHRLSEPGPVRMV